MITRVGLFVFLSFVLISLPALGSTAGEILYDNDGRPLPVHDPAILPSPQSTVELFKDTSKRIEIDLSEQKLSYFSNDNKIDEFYISGGLPRTPTPIGTFSVIEKIPVKIYRGQNYYFPNTKWNLKFLTSGYYIHGAYWHNSFGQPRSHGCINVSYSRMENLYHFADVGTPVIIRN